MVLLGVGVQEVSFLLWELGALHSWVVLAAVGYCYLILKEHFSLLILPLSFPAPFSIVLAVFSPSFSELQFTFGFSS